MDVVLAATTDESVARCIVSQQGLPVSLANAGDLVIRLEAALVIQPAQQGWWIVRRRRNADGGSVVSVLAQESEA